MKYFKLICFTLLCTHAEAQLNIGPTTNWRSDNATYVVLNNTGIQYDAATAQLANVFKFTGNTDASIAGGSLPVFSKIELAKTGLAKIVLQRSINLTQSLSFTSGLFDLNGFALNMGTNALLLNESETSRIMGTDGYARITNNLNAPNGANPGNLGAVITSAQDLGAVTIYRGVRPQVNSAGNGSSVLRFYDIVPTNNAGLNATLRFNYLDAELNGLAENNLVQFKSEDNMNWAAQGYSSRDAILNYVEQTGIADFSRWTLSTPGNSLPVQFSLFTTKCQGGSTLLTWKTATEQNSSQFLVQKSIDGISFTTIGILAAAGNSSVEQTYHFTDNSGAVTAAFYRIAEKDADGRSVFTAINRLQCGNAENFLSVWPNPAHQILSVSINSSSSSLASISLINNNGALVAIQHKSLLAGNNVLQLDLGKLPPGVYNLVVSWNNGLTKEMKQVVKQ